MILRLALFCTTTILISCYVLSTSLPLSAQELPAIPPGATTEVVKELTSEKIENDKRAIDTELKRLSGRELSPYLVSRRELLQQILFTYERQLRAVEARTVLRDSRTLNAEAAAEVVVPPKSFLEFEARRNELASEQAKLKRVETQVSAALFNLESARTEYQAKEKARRKIKEDIDTRLQAVANEPAGKMLQLAKLQSQLAKENIVLRELEFLNAKETKRQFQEELERKTRQMTELGKVLSFGKDDLDQKLKELAEREKDLQTELNKAQAAFHTAEREWSNFRSAKEAETDTVQWHEKSAALEAIKEQALLSVDLLVKRRDFVSTRREIWNQRFELENNNAARRKVKEWADSATREIARLNQENQLDLARLAEFRKQALAIDTKIEHAEVADSETILWLKKQRESVRSARAAYENYLTEADSLKRLLERFLDTSASRLGGLQVREKMSAAKDSISSVWSYELTSIDDRPITVSKVVTAILLFLIGYLLSRRISRQVRRKLFPKLKLAEGVSAALESLLFYFLVIFFALFALKLANVPLTIFTILGGAVAIGIGFGSQNIMNNFISGLILLMEQPIRVGDLVQLDDLTGTVLRIGLRSTIIRASSNIDLIVPNSQFLEKMVVNWTLADRRVRLNIKIGIAYGAPTRQAAEILKKAVQEHAQVLKSPEPLVWFSDFGDNALLFEVHFWSHVKSMTEKRTTESDLRFVIDDLFREAGIVIAFPQRDVHLDTLKPLEVKMVENSLSVNKGQA